MKYSNYAYFEGFVMNNNMDESMHHAFNCKNSEVKDFSALMYFPERNYRYYGIKIPGLFIKKMHSISKFKESREVNPNYIPFCPVLNKFFYFYLGMKLEDANKFEIGDDTVFF